VRVSLAEDADGQPWVGVAMPGYKVVMGDVSNGTAIAPPAATPNKYGVKECTKCHQCLPSTSFYTDRHAKTGLMPWCIECRLEMHASYRKTEAWQACVKKYSQTEKGRARVKRYTLTDKRRAAKKRYAQTEKGKASKARRAHRRRLNGILTTATLTLGEWDKIKFNYKNRCVYCGEKKPLTRDHIIPISKGGGLTKENVIPACVSCNSRKHDKSVLLQILTLACPT
jgi:5-methylcytosine-specific restriction endonuclease McrA